MYLPEGYDFDYRPGLEKCLVTPDGDNYVFDRLIVMHEVDCGDRTGTTIAVLWMGTHRFVGISWDAWLRLEYEVSGFSAIERKLARENFRRKFPQVRGPATRQHLAGVAIGRAIYKFLEMKELDKLRDHHKVPGRSAYRFSALRGHPEHWSITAPAFLAERRELFDETH